MNHDADSKADKKLTINTAFLKKCAIAILIAMILLAIAGLIVYKFFSVY